MAPRACTWCVQTKAGLLFPTLCVHSVVGDKKDKVPFALSPEPWQCPPGFIYYSQAQDSDMAQITSGLGKSLLGPNMPHSPFTCSFFLLLVTRKCDPTRWGQTCTLFIILSLYPSFCSSVQRKALAPRWEGQRVQSECLPCGWSSSLRHWWVSQVASLLPCRGASVPRQVESMPVHGQNWIETLSTESPIFSLGNTSE